MAGPQHGIIGNDFATELPHKEPDAEAITDDQRKARYYKSREFQVFKAKMEEKIEYYKKFLPGGVVPEAISEEERGKYWAVASIVIQEFEAIIGDYKDASERVNESR